MNEAQIAFFICQQSRQINRQFIALRHGPPPLVHTAYRPGGYDYLRVTLAPAAARALTFQTGFLRGLLVGRRPHQRTVLANLAIELDTLVYARSGPETGADLIVKVAIDVLGWTPTAVHATLSSDYVNAIRSQERDVLCDLLRQSFG